MNSNYKFIEILNLIAKHIFILNKFLLNFKNKTELLSTYNKTGINVDKLIEVINNSIKNIEILLENIYIQLCDMDNNLINYIDFTKVKSKIYIENDNDNDKKKYKFCCC